MVSMAPTVESSGAYRKGPHKLPSVNGVFFSEHTQIMCAGNIFPFMRIGATAEGHD